MLLKRAARTVLHSMGGLTVLRGLRSRCSRVLMFHSFADGEQSTLDEICGEIARYYHPVPLSEITNAKSLPDNAVTVTVDDAYRSYFLRGHPVFRRHKIPVTLYAVAAFSDGRLWLWPDQIAFGLEHTRSSSLMAEIAPGNQIGLNLATPAARARSAERLTEALKLVPDEDRRSFLAGFGSLTGVDIPPVPPPHCAPMNWEELRAAAADGVEIGCHTETHPILSRVTSRSRLEREIRGAKSILEFHLRLPVKHFCYPNGRAIDISPEAAEIVRDSGYQSAVTTTWGMNDIHIDPMNVRRIPFDSDTSPQYAAELLAGLHLPPNG
jgi:peptidoglycan/xylan/chitin deacetylase (PgdA/CDA1 family)